MYGMDSKCIGMVWMNIVIAVVVIVVVVVVVVVVIDVVVVEYTSPVF